MGIILLLTLAAVCAGLAVLVARRMFGTCARQDMAHTGSTPARLHVRDPDVAGPIENLYRPRPDAAPNPED